MTPKEALLQILIDYSQERCRLLEERDLFPNEIQLLRITYSPRVERFLSDMLREMEPIIRELLRNGQRW